MNILFLCTGNSCRSILAEATFNALAPAGLRAMSAGSKPAGYVHPSSIALLKRKGFAAEGHYSKSWESLPVTPDIVITVCGNAAGEACPAYLGKAIRAHWGVEDPASAIGTDAEIDEAFETAYLILRKRIEAFLALDLNRFKTPQALAQQLEQIGLLN
jgi:arsenate reductase (thioredoxin)